MDKLLKTFKEIQDANNFIIMNLLPYMDTDKREINLNKIMSIKEFSFFDENDDIRKQYNSLVKSITRQLQKRRIITYETKEEYNYQILEREMRTKKEYTIKNMTYVFS